MHRNLCRALVFIWAVVTAFGALIIGPATVASWAAEGKPPLVGVSLPDFKLSVPHRYEERSYLGTKADGHFKIPELKAQLVIVEVFSMYCPYCQKEAPAVNQLFEEIDRRPGLKNKVKLLGIGAGNTPFEVNAFRNLYHIAFPLFSDTDFALHKALGEVKTPYFLVVKLNPNKSNKVIYSKVGSFGDPVQFLDDVLQKAGLV